MAQNREAPCYQEYAASMMARIEYRTLTLAARGLLYSLRLECWVNRKVPADPRTLARVLGFDADEVCEALPSLAPFVAVDGTFLICPELEDYRSHIEGIRERQSQGGKQGAARTNSKHAKPPTPDGPGNPPGNPRLTRESVVKSSPVKSSPVKQSPDVLTVGEVADPWVSEYDRASNGF
jgi:hypothetical protein